ncbi:LNS2-domain-containing protein [Microthyrium microscopicum]|uniref:LNS2-domain-containing protein n=1 Tax=Microthyrium microscopicum TaxID=703497 RepID=A0A6A6TX31_9PEZI|nr:LNS2-domain-containing protein [Microthyrium microscopicum]
MQYVRSISGSVSTAWNSINPATLSGAIDVIVVEREDGTLACSPFHVRFGKFQLLRPTDKRVDFTVNDIPRQFPMKVGEGGEAFFVFETSDSIPHDLQTSPLVSPVASPRAIPNDTTPTGEIPDIDPLNLESDVQTRRESQVLLGSALERPKSVDGTADAHEGHLTDLRRPSSGDWSTLRNLPENLSAPQPQHFDRGASQPPELHAPPEVDETNPPNEAYARAVALSKKLWTSNIATHISPSGDLMLDMTGYKSDEEQAMKAEVIARKVLAEDEQGSLGIGSLIGADEHGNIWIYSSEESKEAADRKANMRTLNPLAMRSTDAISDPGYHSDDGQSESESDSDGKQRDHFRSDSDSALGLSGPSSPESANVQQFLKRPARNYAKTLRLTNDQLKSLDLKPGPNDMSFTVNKAACQARIFYWKHDVPIVISDIDGTITKSDALGHVLNMIGRDWTHLGVAKLYTDIVANGYNILYLTSRSVGQADTTRGYLNGVVQEGYKLPKGPVILSPDRTMAALRREVYLRKPEVFKMACLRDIMNLFLDPMPAGDPKNFHQRTPFYAGFGNRLTDALSYRSVSIPATRIFTINSHAEISLFLMTLNSYRTSYLSIWELVDHYFPPVGMLVKEGGEEYTDFNYWRDRPLDVNDFSDSESETSEVGTYDGRPSVDGTEQDDMELSFMSEAGRESLDGETREAVVLGTVEEEDELDGVFEGIVEEPEAEYDDEGGDEDEQVYDQQRHDEEFVHGDQGHSYTDAQSQEVAFRHAVGAPDDKKGHDAGGDDDEILVEESRQLEALDLAAEEEQPGLPATMARSVTTPDSPPSRDKTSRVEQGDR